MNEITPTKSKVQIWRERIEGQARCGRSIRAFCEERLISPHMFYYWKRKFSDLRRERSGGRFMVIKKLDLASAPSIYLPNGVRIELGAGLESFAVSQFIRSLCGVGHPPKDGHGAKP